MRLQMIIVKKFEWSREDNEEKSVIRERLRLKIRVRKKNMKEKKILRLKMMIIKKFECSTEDKITKKMW